MKLLSLSGDLFGEGYDRPYEFALACENEVYIEYLSKKKIHETNFSVCLFAFVLECNGQREISRRNTYS